MAEIDEQLSSPKKQEQTMHQDDSWGRACLVEASPCDCAACALCNQNGCAEYLSVAALDSLPANIKVS